LIPLDQWETIRLRCVRDGEPIKTVARDLGLSKNTVRKYVRSLYAPEHAGIDRGCILDPYRSHIDDWLRRSPRITAVRIGALLRSHVNEDLYVSDRTLRDYVAVRRRDIVRREAYIRANYSPGDEMQFDFTPVSLLLSGVLIVVQLFVARLSYSGKIFARVSHRADQPSLFTGLLGAIGYFGGVPRVALFDNAKIAVVKVLRGRDREENKKFREFCGGLALEVEFAAPARGNEKGGVEGACGFVEDNVFRPIPECERLEEINEALLRFCERDEARKSSVHRETIGERFERERPALRALPAVLPAPCTRRTARINKFAEIICETNRYSVPTRWAHRDAVIELFEDRLRIIVGDQCVAEHRRCPGRNQTMLDVRHAVDLLDFKHRSVERAEIIAEGRLPAPLLALRKRLYAEDPRRAGRSFVAVLRLLETYSGQVVGDSVAHALAIGTLDPAAIALLARQRTTPIPAAATVLKLRSAEGQQRPQVDLARYSLDALVESSL
jgi:transposase